MTRYGTKILNLIESSRSHLTAEQIFLELKQSEPKIVLATVYNNLNALVASGSVRKICADGEADRFDNVTKHDHLVCKTCGSLADFAFEDFTEQIKNLLHSEVFGYDLKVFYECPECRNKKQKN